jgi:hypothetical protein
MGDQKVPIHASKEVLCPFGGFFILAFDKGKLYQWVGFFKWIK